MKKRLATIMVVCGAIFLISKIIISILQPHPTKVDSSKESEDNPPNFHFGDGIAFKEGDPRSVQIPTPAKLKVLAPNSGVAKPGEKLECEVSVVLSEGAVLPTFLKIGFLDSRGSIAGDAMLKAKRRGMDGSYIGVGAIRASRKKGRYLLFAKSQVIRRTEPGSGRVDATDVAFDTVSPQIMIEVR